MRGAKTLPKSPDVVPLLIITAGHDDEVPGEAAEDHAGAGGQGDPQRGDQQQALRPHHGRHRVCLREVWPLLHRGKIIF